MSLVRDLYEGSDYDFDWVTQYDIVTEHLELIDDTLRFLRNVLRNYDVTLTHDGHHIIFLNEREDHVLVDPQWLLMAPINEKMQLCAKVLTELGVIPPPSKRYELVPSDKVY